MKADDVIAHHGSMISGIAAMGLERFALNPFGTHGINHWHRVLRNSISICLIDGYDLDERMVRALALFAMMHDCEREDEDSDPDPDHGHRAAEAFDSISHAFEDRLGIVLTETVHSAIRYHNAGRTSDTYLTQVMWAADRLDLVRVGIEPSPRLLKLNSAIALIGVP